MPRKGRKAAKTIGERIRAAREAAGWKQTELAAAAGTTQDHVSDIERGVHAPGAKMLVRLAGALGIEPGELL